ncbi:tetratricopeptide repeat protein [Nocardioides daphniae]|uniref:Co-chaperone YbbN n=1 Tax=Nocardioides daphniae TaxID=402297 RepID=A0A4P7UE63_9ACTN|nr:tetratricopeptide repeat protein [Nocardioides daphniae]QCC77685.1 tetratricopeptide repeat protein [Nocardioides daphniae]GGD29470.1 co-chaperone YbbN [Nocardioides daphniae]
MSQQPFSRPGAYDLSALKRQAPPSAPSGQPASGAATGGGGGGVGGGTAYSVPADEQNFQAVLEASMTAPVLLVFFSAARMPESADLAEDMTTLADEFEGRFLVATVDVDAVPQIAQAMQIPSIPIVVAVVDGRPMPLFQDVAPIDQLRTALTQVAQQLTTQGITGRHQPRSTVVADEAGVPAVDPRYAAAQDALGEGDIDRAVAEYQKLVDANPADTEAAAGLAMAKLLQRTRGVDLQEARRAAADAPDDLDAQIMVADLDMLGGHVEDAFNRLVEAVRRTSGDERTKVRDHLVALFGAVGNDDPRVLRGRQNLASALF